MIRVPISVTYTPGDWISRWTITASIPDGKGGTKSITASSGQWDIAVAEWRFQALGHLPSGTPLELELAELETHGKVWASPVVERVGREGQIRVVPRYPLRGEPYCLGVRRYG